MVLILEIIVHSEFFLNYYFRSYNDFIIFYYFIIRLYSGHQWPNFWFSIFRII